MNEFERSIKVLDLKGEVSKDTVKIAYKKLIKIHHPDFFTNEKNKAKVTENFKKIKKAYDYLLEYIEDRNNLQYDYERKGTEKWEKTKEV